MDRRISAARAQLSGHLSNALAAALRRRSWGAAGHCMRAYAELGDAAGGEAALRAALAAPVAAEAVQAARAALAADPGGRGRRPGGVLREQERARGLRTLRTGGSRGRILGEWAVYLEHALCSAAGAGELARQRCPLFTFPHPALRRAGARGREVEIAAAASLGALEARAGPLLQAALAPGSGLAAYDLLGAVVLAELGPAIAEGLPGAHGGLGRAGEGRGREREG